MRPWLLPLSVALAVVFLALRYSPADHWIRPEVYGWLIDKWRLGPARIVNFAALTVVLVRFGSTEPTASFLPGQEPRGQIGFVSQFH